jgi:uncharacterized protein (DUF1810 family)
MGDNGGMGDENYRVGRFVQAQDDPPAGCGSYGSALAELRAGRKTGHWIWYVFPQLELGSSAMSVRYSVSGLDEARAYLAHPTLRERLHACMDAVLDAAAATARELVGDDAWKLRSSATLFLRADPDDARYQAVLEKYFGGQPDAATDQRLGTA